MTTSLRPVSRGAWSRLPSITITQSQRKHDIGCSGRQELLRDPRISEALRVASRATKEPRAIAGRSGAPCSLSKLWARGLPLVVSFPVSGKPHFRVLPASLQSPARRGRVPPPPPYVQHIPYSAGPRGGSAHSLLAAQCPEGWGAGTRGQQIYGCLDPHSPRTSTGNQTEAVSVPFGGKFPP